MTPITAADPLSQSADLVGANVARLREQFPEAFTEDGLDFDVLKQLLGGAVAEGQEKYGLTWHGKRLARQLALTPSVGTLRPAKADSADWDTTQNLMIEGDNLEVLKLLQKSYSGKVKLIYIDPPYNTGNDFVYKDNFRDPIGHYKRETGQTDENGHKTSTNSEASGRFHTNWLNMMYPRLMLARNLLHEDGSIFVSLDDHEVHHLRILLNDIFGEENFRADIAWQKRYTRSNNTINFTATVENILVYSRSDTYSPSLLPRTEEADARYSNPDDDARGPWKGASFLNPATPKERPNLCYPLKNPKTGRMTLPTTNAWRRSKDEFERLAADNRLYWGADETQPVPAIKMFLSEGRGLTPINFWSHGYAGNTDDGTKDLTTLLGEKVFDNPKPVLLLKRVLEHSADANSIVLDFFAGSSTTGQAVLELNREDGGSRRFIMVQLPETTENKTYPTIAEIAKERLRRAAKKVKADAPLFAGDVGFRVYKLDTSNIRPWEPDRADLAQSIQFYTDHIREDRTEDDVLTELLLKLGLDLCVPIEKQTIAGKTVHSVAGVLLVCLADRITAADAQPLAHGIADWHRDLDPVGESQVVFRDSAFDGDDVAKANLTENLKQRGLEKVRSL